MYKHGWQRLLAPFLTAALWPSVSTIVKLANFQEKLREHEFGVQSCAYGQPRGDAAHAAFDRHLSHCRNEIGELRKQGTRYRPLVWTADGRPHLAVTRHRFQSERAADVGEITSSQVEV